MNVGLAVQITYSPVASDVLSISGYSVYNAKRVVAGKKGLERKYQMSERKLPLEQSEINGEIVYHIHEMHSVNDVLRHLVKEVGYNELLYLTSHLDYTDG